MFFGRTTRQYEEYAYGMMRRGHGYAFLDPASDFEAKPGICGFVNENGRWQKLVDLNDAKELTDNGFGAFTSTMQQKPPKHDKYGPITTDTVARIALSAEAAAAIADLPVRVGAVSKYELQGEFGAILVCHDLVECKSYPLKHDFRKWAKANARQILKKFPDAKKNKGFYIMTSTMSARDIRITSWSSKGESVVIGASADVSGAAKISASTELYLGQAVSEWHEPKPKEQERLVLFFGGIRMRYSRLWPTGEQDETKWTGYRGEDDDKFMLDDDEDVCEVEIDDM